MKTRPFLATAAAGVVAAMVVPSLAHAWRLPAGSGFTPGPAATAAQQATPEGTRRLAPLAGGSTALPRGGAPAPATPSPGVLRQPPTDADSPAPDIAKLFGEPNLALREQHFEAIVARAAVEPAVRGALEALAGDTNSELAWSARLALREVRATSGAAARAGALDPFSQLERMFGTDPFGDPFFTHPFGALGRSPFAPPQPGGVGPDSDPFERMRSGLRRLEELVVPPSNGGIAPGATPTPRTGTHFQGRSESLSVTPDGVRLEVEEDGPDGRTSRTYEARTLEELYTAHPELRPGKR